MMLRYRVSVLVGVACLWAAAGHAEDKAVTVIGVNPYLADGANALKFGDYEEGIRLTQLGLKALTKPADRIGALSNLCAGYVGTRDFNEALRYCNRALRLDEKHWRAYNNRSLAYLGLGNLEAAQRDVSAGIAINPTGRSLQVVQSMINEAAKQPAVSTPPPEDEQD
jgi:tetratricopeptide (TPR) repeat protein